jgi:hypothetical protein
MKDPKKNPLEVFWPGHEVRPSGAGWMCSCRSWGWTKDQIEEHRQYTQTSPAEKAVDAAWERNQREWRA